MFTTWIRNNKYAAGILAIVRIYLGYEFISAGWEKLTGPKAFTAAGFLANAVKHPVLGTTKQAVYPWFNSFISGVALPHVALFNVLVPYGEFLVGLGLILGTLTTTAVFFGMMMNLMYMFAGTVSTNPMDLFLGIFIIVAGFNAGYFGGDYFVIPMIRRFWARMRHTEVAVNIGGTKARG